MYKNKLIFCLLLLVTYNLIAVNAGKGKSNAYLSGRRTINSWGGNPGGGYQQSPTDTQMLSQTPKEYLDRNSGLSTFGIIAIIFAVILSCLIFYYGIICYPFLCRDEKKYRFMDGSSTITAATSRSIQSIENFPVDQKHQCV